MESIGERLIHARQERNLSREQAARETHISQRFIEALENEYFDMFPGESYLLGFLRKYSKYLDINADEMAELFKNTTIQEQPSPVVELLDRSSQRRRVMAISIVGVICIVTAITVVIILNLPKPAPLAELPSFQTIAFTSDILEREFTAWSRIQVSQDEQIYEIELREITDPLNLYVNEGSVQLEPNDVEFVDLDDDLRSDLRVVYKTLSDNGNPVLRMDRIIAGIFAQDSVETEGPIRPGITRELSRKKSVQEIITLSDPGTFFIEAIFRGPVFFRYLNEDGERGEQFYNNGDRLELEVENYLYIWVSNAGKLAFTVSGQDLRLGRDGAVGAYQIAKSGNVLELMPLY
ncbi:MAG: helix-turn-helix domain-containing protein [Salinispira sp.]